MNFRNLGFTSSLVFLFTPACGHPGMESPKPHHDSGSGTPDTDHDSSGIDGDHDGYDEEHDCDDADAATHPGAADAPLDDEDRDCDGTTLATWTSNGQRVDEGFGSALLFSSSGQLYVGAPHGDPGRLYTILDGIPSVLLEGLGADLLGVSLAASDDGRVLVGAPWRADRAGAVLDSAGTVLLSGSSPGDLLGGRLAASTIWAATTVAGIRRSDGTERSTGEHPGSLAILADGSTVAGLPWGSVALSADSSQVARGRGEPDPPRDEAGAALATGGDLDGDGTADLVVGAPGTGRVYVLSLVDVPDRLDSALVIDGGGERFGQALAVADLNGDGISDLVVGAPNAGPDQEGSLYVFEGPLGPSLGPADAIWSDTGDAGDHLGAALAAWSSGFAAGAPGRADRSGMVRVFSGSSSAR
jgi:hypothetical protein